MYCLVIYGVVNDDVRRIPGFLRAFFSEYPSGDYDEGAILLEYSVDELAVIDEYVALEYPFYSSSICFGMVIGIASATPERVLMPSWRIRRRCKKLMIRYDLVPDYWNLVLS